MDALNVALVGIGGRGRAHANAMAAAPNINFVAICDIDEEVGTAAAEEFETEYVPSTDELYARDDIEAVGICVQTPLHHKLAMEAIEAGRHLLTEKPMAASHAEAREMKEAVAEADLVAALSYQLRFGPVYRKMKELAGQINPLQVMFARQRGMLKEQYLTPKPFDGIMDFISHDIDMVPFLAGLPPRAVCTTLRRNTWQDRDAIDVIGAQVEFGDEDDPVIGYISSSMGGGGMPQRLDIVGESGFAYLSGNTITFTTSENPPGPQDRRDMWDLESKAEGRDYTADLYEHWASCVLDRSRDLAPAASYEDGYNALLLTLAMVESGRIGEKVVLEEYAKTL
ncbi:MAG: Gfo/Idh/MocA family protein [Armatimonadota bacterium]